jgi:oxalate decarboxylase/phosphoglucose isomerase-like protein (cupin superfamily)
MTREAQIEKTAEGQVPAGDGWFILNLGEMAWETVPPYGVWLGFFAGIHVHVLQPGETNGYYHAEDAQEGFLVLSGECIAVVEGEERRLRQWDYFHSPPGTEHITVGAGDEPCAILMFGAPDPSRKVSWIASETAAKYGASVAQTTSVGTDVYGEVPPLERVPAPRPFRD